MRMKTPLYCCRLLPHEFIFVLDGNASKTFCAMECCGLVVAIASRAARPQNFNNPYGYFRDEFLHGLWRPPGMGICRRTVACAVTRCGVSRELFGESLPGGAAVPCAGKFRE